MNTEFQGAEREARVKRRFNLATYKRYGSFTTTLYKLLGSGRYRMLGNDLRPFTLGWHEPTNTPSDHTRFLFSHQLEPKISQQRVLFPSSESHA
jgi:hypothetical protein